MTTSLSPRLAKAQRVSVVLRLVCRVVLGGSILIGVGVLVPMAQAWSTTAPDHMGYRVGSAIVSVVTLVYWTAGVWALERLFDLFVRGRMLDRGSGMWLKRFGFWMATAPLVAVLLRGAFNWVQSGRFDTASEGSATSLLGSLLAGLFLLMLGWVLEEGGELKAEQDLTV